LTAEEKEKLISALILKRNREKNPENILGNLYLINGEGDGTPTKDAREFSTLLNACGRLNRASFGIGACLNDSKMKKRAVESLVDYKKEIMNSIKWFEDNKENSKKIIKGEGYIILKPENEVAGTMIGTLTSIISRNKEIKPNTFIMSLADQDDYNVKVSIRIANLDDDELDAKKIVEEITNIVGGESGGHKTAAGAIINYEIQNEFVNKAVEIFESMNSQKIVVP
jgi:RecJ-like exonuclease